VWQQVASGLLAGGKSRCQRMAVQTKSDFKGHFRFKWHIGFMPATSYWHNSLNSPIPQFLNPDYRIKHVSVALLASKNFAKLVSGQECYKPLLFAHSTGNMDIFVAIRI